MSKNSNPTNDPMSRSATMAPQRVMRVIDALAASRDGLTLTQIWAQTQLPKTSLLSILRSLAEGGYTISEGRFHRLGPQTYRIARAIARTDQFPGNVHALLEKLQKDCGETVMIGVPTEDWAKLVYVDVIESTSSLRFSINIGAERPMYSTTVGKILLAFASGDQAASYLSRTDLVAVTSHTVTDREVLVREFEEARRHGYIFSSGSVEGATGIAAPVFDAAGKLAGALAAAGPSERLRSHREEFIHGVVQCAGLMSTRLGYTGPYPKPV